MGCRFNCCPLLWWVGLSLWWICCRCLQLIFNLRHLIWFVGWWIGGRLNESRRNRFGTVRSSIWTRRGGSWRKGVTICCSLSSFPLHCCPGDKNHCNYVKINWMSLVWVSECACWWSECESNGILLLLIFPSNLINSSSFSALWFMRIVCLHLVLYFPRQNSSTRRHHLDNECFQLQPPTKTHGASIGGEETNGEWGRRRSSHNIQFVRTAIRFKLTT